MTIPRRAILFLNLGGPEKPGDVKDFLYRLFADPEVIRIPWRPLRLFVAWLISTLREKKSQALYATIGGGSPIRRLTDLQAAGTEKLLRADRKDVVVRTAFTCSAPLLEDVMADLARAGVERFLAFPLYPQYSLTTTKGSLDRVRAMMARLETPAALHVIESWPVHPTFIQAHAELISAVVASFKDPRPEKIHLLFSAHSIPEKLVTEEGDPYRDQIEQTVAAVLKHLGWKGPHTLAWQSKLGPVKWLGPSTMDVIEELGKKGTPQVLVVPIAFVSDHIETLNEIDIQFADAARAAGIGQFLRTPGLNENPTFIRALAEIAAAKTDFWR